jgi:phosphatidylglycerol:prolipoprotein diacylglycerol transferase
MPTAFIPFLEQPKLELGFATIYAWGVMVALGFIIGSWLAARRAERQGLDAKIVLDYALWAFVGGFIGAHIVHVLFYEPEMLTENPWSIFFVWEGVSSFGGFLGAAVASVIFFRLRKAKFMDYADPLAFGMAVGWGLGRIGCFLAHDHKGFVTDFFLAVDFPDGPRHDLGLYDAILTWIIFGVLHLVERTKPGKGAIAGVLCALYAVPRFFFDYLRASDARYGGLTPGQYGAIALFLFGAWVVVSARNRPRDLPGTSPPASPAAPEPTPSQA